MTMRIRTRLERASPVAFSTYATVAAFSAYFCMYAFRKPFAAGTFADQEVWGVDLKIALVIGQVIGYALSKLLSIKLVSELGRRYRTVTLIALICAAELALVGLGTLPPGGQVAAMFFNGIPLGAVWGLVFAYLEGRRTSEILGAGLSMSYIVASGAVKSVGRYAIAAGVPEHWMPASVGCLFLLPFALAVWLLHCMPAPTDEDQAQRTERAPMDGAARLQFFRKYGLGLTSLTVLYILLTAYRDFRDNFAVELWSELGFDEAPVLTWSEVPVAFSVMIALGLIFMIKDNRRAFFVVHAVMLLGALLIGISTLLFQLGVLPGEIWMVLVGSGLYLGYVPFGCVLFDRLMAMTRNVGTAVFMIYVTDAFGYVGSVGLMLFKNFGSAELAWLPFFINLSLTTAAMGTVGFVVSGIYFARRIGRAQAASPAD